MPSTTVRPIAAVTVDNPHADGYIQQFGFEWDEQFKSTGTAYEGGGIVHSGTERLEALQCVKPRGYYEWRDMEIGGENGWLVGTGKWRTTTPAISTPQVKFLDYYDTSPQAYGIIAYPGTMWPQFGLGIIRQAPAANAASYPRYVSVALLGTPDHADRRKFQFVFPLADDTYSTPYLLAADYAETETWVKVAEWQTENRLQSATGPRVEGYRFEVLDGYLVVRNELSGEVFSYRPDSAEAFSGGPVRVTVYGHAAMVYLRELTYPLASAVTLESYANAGTTVNNLTRTWHAHYWRPDPTWTVYAEELASTDLSLFKPQVRFVREASTGRNKCPVCYVATGQAPAVHAAGTSEPDALTGEGVVDRVSYVLNYEGRGQTCSIGLRDKSSAKTWRGNNKVTVTVGWQHATGTDTGQRFLGYVAGSDGVSYETDFAKWGTGRYVTMQVADPIASRLDKKFMVNTSAANGEDLPQWVYWVLYNAGVPAAQLTDIAALIGTGPTVPMGLPPGDLRFSFGADVTRTDAIMRVCASLDREFGFSGVTGKYYLRTAPIYSGTPDATVTNTSLFSEPKFVQSIDDFRNYLLLVGQFAGRPYNVLYRDTNSHYTTSAEDFLGDDWWDVISEPDMAQGTGLVARRWRQLQRSGGLVTWAQKGVSTLYPGKFVKWQATGQNIPTDTIFQIIEERGELEAGGQWLQRFTARLWVA